MAAPRINIEIRNVTTQRGYFIPSQDRYEIIQTTSISRIYIYTLGKGYSFRCTVNGEIKTWGADFELDGEIIQLTQKPSWIEDFKPGDIVVFSYLNSARENFLQDVVLEIKENGVVEYYSLGKGVNLRLTQESKQFMDINSDYRQSPTRQSA